MAIYFLIHFYERFHSARKERALLNEACIVSQLEALLLQRNPHFLFNALNTIRALIPAASFRSSKNGFPPNSSSERTALSWWTWSRL